MARTVRVFQHAVEELADSPSDPITEQLEVLAEEIRQVAMENIHKIIPYAPESILAVDSGQDTKGLFFRVRLDGQGHLSSYLSGKELREHAWFEPAVAEVVGPENLRTPIG